MSFHRICTQITILWPAQVFSKGIRSYEGGNSQALHWLQLGEFFTGIVLIRNKMGSSQPWLGHPNISDLFRDLKHPMTPENILTASQSAKQENIWVPLCRWGRGISPAAVVSVSNETKASIHISPRGNRRLY